LCCWQNARGWRRICSMRIRSSARLGPTTSSAL
jgi:hypothetical protein